MRRIWSYIAGDSDDPKYALHHPPHQDTHLPLSAATHLDGPPATEHQRCQERPAQPNSPPLPDVASVSDASQTARTAQPLAVAVSETHPRDIPQTSEPAPSDTAQSPNYHETTFRDTLQSLKTARQLATAAQARSSSPTQSNFNTFTSSVQALEKYEAVLKTRHTESVEHSVAINALRVLAEVLVWADQHDSAIWDTFMEFGVMALFVRCLHANNSILQSPNPAQPEPPPSELPAEREPEARTVSSDVQPDADLTPTTTSTPSTAATSAKPSDDAPSTEQPGQPNPRLQVVMSFQSQLLQALSIVVQSVTNTRSHYCLFSANHINTLIEFHFDLSSDEVLSYYVTLLKTIALKLDSSMLQFFFDPATERFPLYTASTALFDHAERMVRISARSATLRVLSVGDERAVAFALRTQGSGHPDAATERLARLCGGVARALELVLDDGAEVPRTRARTGLFRRRVRFGDVAARLGEVEALALHLADAHALQRAPALAVAVRNALSTRLFAPFFRPLASRASPRSLAPRGRWPAALRAPANTAPVALVPFDAAARLALLAFVVTALADSRLIRHAVAELLRPSADFEHRSISHALKAMAADFTGTERVSYLALRVIETLVAAPAVPLDMLAAAQLTLDAAAPAGARTRRAGGGLCYDEEDVRAAAAAARDDEPMLMTLTDFEAPLTPCASLPSTPTRAEAQAASPRADGDEQIADALRRTPMKQRMGDESGSGDEERLLVSFRTGDASLRDVLMSALLVVRRREARSLRVIQTVSRIVAHAANRTNAWLAALDLAGVVLDEVATSLCNFIHDRRTTIVALETAFTSYEAAHGALIMQAKPPPCGEVVLTSEDLTRTASQQADCAGRVRRAPMGHDYTAPIECADAHVLFAMARLYEQAHAAAFDGLGAGIMPSLRVVFDNVDEDCSYLEKRDALDDIAAVALKARPA